MYCAGITRILDCGLDSTFCLRRRVNMLCVLRVVLTCLNKLIKNVHKKYRGQFPMYVRLYEARV